MRNLGRPVSMQLPDEPLIVNSPPSNAAAPRREFDVSSPSVEVSVVIVNYNVKDFLLQCLRSVQRATHDLGSELLVVDNSSTDGTVSCLQPLFPNVTFISLEQNIGFARANNLAIQRARGEFILFLNPDTLLEEDTLKVMLAYMRTHPEVGLSGCKVLNQDGTLQLACRRAFPTPWSSVCKIFGLQKLFPRSR